MRRNDNRGNVNAHWNCDRLVCQSLITRLAHTISFKHFISGRLTLSHVFLLDTLYDTSVHVHILRVLPKSALLFLRHHPPKESKSLLGDTTICWPKYRVDQAFTLARFFFGRDKFR